MWEGSKVCCREITPATDLMYEVYWERGRQKATLEGDMGERRREQETGTQRDERQ